MDQLSHVVIPDNLNRFTNSIIKWYKEHPTVHVPKQNEPNIIPIGSSVGFSKQ